MPPLEPTSKAEDPPVMSFLGIQVRDDTVLGDDTVLDLYVAAALVGRVGEFPRHLRTALARDSSVRDDRPHLVVCTPYGDLLRRTVAPEMEAGARTFATYLNAASWERRRSWEGPQSD